MVTQRKTYVFVAVLAVYAWAMALGYSSLHFVQDLHKPLSQHWHQLDDLTNTFHHTVPTTHFDYTADTDESSHYPTIDNHIAVGHSRDVHLTVGDIQMGASKAPIDLINKNKAALLYPFHFFF
ncbi:hypothetical protein [Allomuricauda sp. F6463D]|uniref:hypothetical protein n=1 Tax=Allomuricauda sp. F6463D TaxID=2926409 RepID=UPI001FF25976|nr:hypothetical protein [Muricauda sp. F6463D]MCK0160360.1 hypothetical protein [Muricauda sp. F6463D]